MKCRSCHCETNTVFVDLGESPPSNSFLKSSSEFSREESFPLVIYVCEKCFLVQIGEHKSAREIFSSDYVYFSSFSKSWLDHSKKYVEQMFDRLKLNGKSLVVEVASNDGYLLQYFVEKGVPVLGVEPTSNTAEVAISKGISTLIKFFGLQTAQEIRTERGPADLILGNNVLAHVPDINDFVAGARALVKESGTITFEFPHLLQLVKNNQFDTIYHEHFSYLSLQALLPLFERHGLKLYDVQELATHGGSLRVFLAPLKNDKQYISEDLHVREAVKIIIDKEKAAGLDHLEFYQGFQAKVEKIKKDLLQFLKQQKAEGKSVVAYGAAAKGNTLFNYCHIDSSLVDFVVDLSPHKQGLYLPGSHLQVCAPEKISEVRPDFVMILPWNLKAEIEQQLQVIRSWGGKFVIAIPHLEIF